MRGVDGMSQAVQAFANSVIKETGKLLDRAASSLHLNRSSAKSQISQSSMSSPSEGPVNTVNWSDFGGNGDLNNKDMHEAAQSAIKNSISPNGKFSRVGEMLQNIQNNTLSEGIHKFEGGVKAEVQVSKFTASSMGQGFGREVENRKTKVKIPFTNGGGKESFINVDSEGRIYKETLDAQGNPMKGFYNQEFTENDMPGVLEALAKFNQSAQ